MPRVGLAVRDAIMFNGLASARPCMPASAWAARPLAVSGRAVLVQQREGVRAHGRHWRVFGRGGKSFG